MRLIKTYPNDDAIEGNSGEYNSGSGSDVNVMKPKNLVDHLLHGKSAMMLSHTHSPNSSLDIKVTGGKKKTTPPSSKKANTNKLNGRTKRRRSSSNDDKEYYQVYGDDSEGHELYGEGLPSGGEEYSKNKNSVGADGKRRDDTKTGGRGKNSKNEEKKNQRRKQYAENTHSTNKSSSRNKGITGSDSPDDLEVPVGQWIAILSAIFVIAYHHFNLGQKLSKFFSSREKAVSKKKEITGKKTGLTTKKNKKRGKEVTKNMSKSKNSNHIPTLSTGTTTENKKQQTKSSSDEHNKQGDDIVSELEKTSVILKESKKKKKIKKTVKKEQKQSKEQTNTPDSISTDGSSSTEGVETNDEEDPHVPMEQPDLPIEPLSYSDEIADEGEWLTVGAVNSKKSTPRASKVKSNVTNTYIASKSTESKENKPSPPAPPQPSPPPSPSHDIEAEEEIKLQEDDVSSPPVATPTNDSETTSVKIDNNEVESKVTQKQRSAPEKPPPSTPVPEKKVEEKVKEDNSKSANVPNTEEEDAAFARMLQKQEEEMVAAHSKTNDNGVADDCWEEVSKKKRGKKP